MTIRTESERKQKLDDAKRFLQAGQKRLDRWNHARLRMGVARELNLDEATKALAFAADRAAKEIREFLE